MSLKIHGILTFAENTGVCEPRNGPRSVTEKTGGCERPPEAPPKKLDVRGLAISITYAIYYCRLLLIIDYYYLELYIDPL